MAQPPESIGRRIQSRIYEAGVFGRKPSVPVTATELEKAGLAAMPRPARGYIQTGAGTGATMRANAAAFDRWQFTPQLLRDVSQRDASVTLFGSRHPSPYVLSPIGVLEMAHGQGDLAVAHAAAATGVPMVISSQASYPMEEIASALGDSPRWFQLYWSNQPTIAESFVRRAEACGCSAIVVTVDTMVLSWRTLDLDIAFLPFARGLGIAQYTSDPAFQALVRERLSTGKIRSVDVKPSVEAARTLVTMSRAHPGSFRANVRSDEPRAAVQTFLDVFSRQDLAWDDLAWLRSITDLPIVVKGLQSAADAALALEHGVDGIWVSNHGGRQLDGAIGSLDALADIAPVVDGRMPVIFDSGVRCAADALKALALGATAVGLGRPYCYGLAIAGSDGVREVIEHFQAELDLSMAVAGVTSLSELSPSSLRPAPAALQ